MAITPEKAVQQLEAAGWKLERVQRHLIDCEPPDTQVEPLLRQVAEILGNLQSERDLLSGHESMQQLLTDIRARTVRTELLLQSAARLVCNSALERPLIEGSYTPDGKISPLEFGGRIIIHI